MPIGPNSTPTLPVQRAIFAALESGPKGTPEIVASIGMSKRTTVYALQYLVNGGYLHVTVQEAIRTRTGIGRGRMYVYDVVSVPAAVQEPEGNARRGERYDATALYAALSWPLLPAGRPRPPHYLRSDD